jgi:hypothetical protein
MEYKIVSRQGDRELEAAVNELIAEGWQPLGGVSVVVLHQTWENERKGYTESDTQWVYSQAMTRSNEFGKGMPANDEPEKGTERAEH